MKTHCRCRKCRARKALKRHPMTYITQPRCQCGARDWAVDAWANARPWRDPTKLCHCDGVWFSIKGAPHRKGSKGCNYSIKQE